MRGRQNPSVNVTLRISGGQIDEAEPHEFGMVVRPQPAAAATETKATHKRVLQFIYFFSSNDGNLKRRDGGIQHRRTQQTHSERQIGNLYFFIRNLRFDNLLTLLSNRVDSNLSFSYL
jgi:hypothetical protein